MQKSNAPTKLTVVFASGSGAGPVNNVPLTPGPTPGTASYQTGFTSVNMEPIASGGIPPFGADFNGVIKNSTTAQIWQQAGYMWPYDSGFASNANIGGYPAGSVLLMESGNGFWINQADNNATNPDATGSSGWVGFPASGLNTINTTGGTVIPDPSVLGSTVLFVSGALTSNAIIQLPLTAGAHWIVNNVTTGSYSLTVQGSSGGGVSIPSGSSYLVYTEGFNYHAIASPLDAQYLPINGTAVAATKLATARNFSISGFATAAAVSFDGTGNVVFNVTALNVAGALGYTPANDASVVHLAGNETITGAKIFSGGLTSQTANDANPHIAATFGPADASKFLTLTANNGAYIWNAYWYGSATYHWQFNGVDVLMLNSVGITVTGAINGGTGTFSGAVSTAALTCTTMNASGSDRRLKRNIRKFNPRPLHRSARFVSYTLKSNGWNGLGSVAQDVRKIAPEHVGEFEQDGKKYLSLNYAGMAYEQAVWDGHEIDRLAKRIEKLERSRLPRKPGFLRRLREIVW